MHVRSHFLLNTGDGTPAMKWGSTNVYTEDAAGNPVYDWTLTDGIMDTITGRRRASVRRDRVHARGAVHAPDPVPQLRAPPTLDGGCFYPPTDYTKWAALIRAWATHANERYPGRRGELAVGAVERARHRLLARHVRRVRASSTTTRRRRCTQVLPDAPLGGPAVAGAGGSFLTQFLQHCATGTNAVTGETGTRLDLVTFHAKGGVAVSGDHVEMDLGNQLRLHRAGFNAVAAVPQFKQTPIYITEADPDGCAACPASTIARRRLPQLARVRRVRDRDDEAHPRAGGARSASSWAACSTWAFTFPGTPYFAGYRALATNGINLPVMGAFKLLGRLAGTRLPLTSSGARDAGRHPREQRARRSRTSTAMATLNGAAIQVLVWNYHDELVTVAGDAGAPGDRRCRRASAPARASRTCASTSRTATRTPSGCRKGMPASPVGGADRGAAGGDGSAPLVPDTTVAVAAGGAVGVDFDLPRFGVSLVTVEPGDSLTNGTWP